MDREAPCPGLCIEILSGPSNGRRRRYADSSRLPIESLLNAFIVCLYRTAEDIKAERKRLDELRLQREEEERRRQEWEQLRQQKLEEIRQEQERVQSLLDQAASWRKSQDVRRYAHALRDALIARHGQIEDDSGAAQWLAWAERQADRFDPLIDSPKSILDEKEQWERTSYWQSNYW